MKKLWGGRFNQTLNKKCESFTSSISFDKRLYPYDIDGSIAHVKMLAKCKIISAGDRDKIIKGLKAILSEMEKGKFAFKKEDEDIHMAIEKRLIHKIGAVGEKLHTARSRNDQVLVDVRMYLREEIKNLVKLISGLQKGILEVCAKNMKVIMPGFTHLQHAQPILISHHLLAYHFMLKRDKARLEEIYGRVNICPLGVGALAGVNYPVDRKYTAKLLGFSKVTENSVDTVSDRDFILEFLSAAAILTMHLSRLAEELILWTSPEFNFVELEDSFCTGSSIMPQKKNPDVLELVRGKTGKIYGNLLSLLTVMKGLPLSYNRDLQEDKVPLFETIDVVKNEIGILTELITTMKINKEKMLQRLKQGMLEATDIADYLVKKGMPFRQSHNIVGQLVKYCLKKKADFHNLSLSEFKSFSDKFGRDIFNFIKIENCIKRKNSLGGTSYEQVEKTITGESKELRA